jgi:NTP pyrophosphatase (non-canonical NTP hydrolase)
MDNVNKPKHYTSGKIEVIDYIKDKLTPEQYKGYLLGNVIKYTSRFQLKNGLEDLEKGRVYLDWLAKVEAGEVKTPKHEADKAVSALYAMMFPKPTWEVPKIRRKPINALCREAYENAKEKGWHDKPRSFGDVIALIHSELSEAVEDYREGREINETWYEKDGLKGANYGLTAGGKPCGIPSELADVCIRIFDFCGEHGIDLESMIVEKMAYNATRPNRHGGKTL